MGKFSSGMPTTDYFKFAEGDNRVRILTDGAVVSKHFATGVCYGKDKGCKGCALYEADQKNKDLDDKEKNKNKGSFKKMFWVIDRNDQSICLKEGFGNPTESIKLAEFGSRILQALDTLAENPDYKFDTFPMPYDITINANGAGKTTVKYNVVPSPKIVPLTESENAVLGKKHSTAQIVETMKEKQAKKEGNPLKEEETRTDIEYPEEEISPEDIPFNSEQ